MRTSAACISCLTRQAVEAAQQVCDDEAVIERAIKRVLREASQFDMALSPPEMAQIIHRILRQETRSADPYAHIKARAATMALSLAHKAKTLIALADDPFEAAVRFAIAGNILDFAVLSIDENERINDTFLSALQQPIDVQMVQRLAKQLQRANRVLMLADNVGETFFDKLLIEQLPPHIEVVYAVKASPVINDATSEDTLDAGIAALATVIDNGTDAPGTPLAQCSTSFKHFFDTADVVIAKGQANFETLNDVAREVYFLTQIKCDVLAQHYPFHVGEWVITTNHQLGLLADAV